MPKIEPQQKKKTKSVWTVAGDYKLLILGLLGSAIAVNGMNLVFPKLIANAIDAYIKGTLMIGRVSVEFAVAAIITLIFTFAQFIFQTIASERVARDLRQKLSAKISRQDYLYIERVSSARLLTNLTSDVDGVKMFISQAAVLLISSLLLIIGANILLIRINWKLALTVLTMIPLIAAAFILIFSKIGPLFKKGREAIDWLNKVINESILGAALIRVLHSEVPEARKFNAANSEAQAVGISILKLFASVIPIIMFVSSLASVAILAMGGHFVINGTMTLGDLSAFQSYVGLLIFPIVIIGFVSSSIAQAEASYARINEVLEAEEPKEIGSVSAPLSGEIELRDVTLKGGEKDILKSVSLKVEPRTKTAIIGPTAAGKTQLLYLLIGLIDPTAGEVLYGGIKLRDYNTEALHRNIGFVFQDSIMFNLSLRENIAFSSAVTKENLDKAIETAELSDFIASLPQGLDTLVSERGTSLSGGQKQRVMLARALALNPKVLLLDDFTARVDAATERRILANVRENYPDLTLVSVTQKIAPIEGYDRIFVLMEGELIAEGTHRELMEKSPEYVQIFDSQKSTNAYELQA